ncbi:MAG TPA: type II secretion system protein [Candidatus Paceibacterota bacterium]|nr:type II secretion system protein [Verrucomicrobiota bacterium]HRZ46181.1 type II secretion system protein [Candidatus Paceibacterota bacterium]HRZ91658.1 type II secretion system protein [Candidatus Paceibacterota bacterium]
MKARAGAFTLVELLVVVAIVGVLAGLLLPVLAQGREKAARLVCLSNVRQIALATLFYAQENSDYLPHPNADFDVTVAGWLCRPPFTKPLTNLHTGLLWRTLRNYPVYRCPLDRTNAPLFEWRLQKYSSYIMNWAVTGFRITRATHKLSRFRPEAVLFWQGDEKNVSAFNDGSSDPADGITRLHQGGTPAGAASGAVEFMSPSAHAAELALYPGRLWCNPTSPTGDHRGQPPGVP